MKPFAESSLSNRDPILAVIKPLFTDFHHILEIGSGTGQHAVYFAESMPQLIWQPTDRKENLAGIELWRADAQLANVQPAIELDVMQPNWPSVDVDAVFSANTLHIMNPAMVAACFAGVGRLLKPGALFVVYGPFNYGGQYTSDSNARFDQWLAAQQADRAIRNFEDVDALAQQAGMSLLEDYAMPANNRILCWQKQRQA